MKSCLWYFLKRHKLKSLKIFLLLLAKDRGTQKILLKKSKKRERGEMGFSDERGRERGREGKRERERMFRKRQTKSADQ